MIITTVIEKEKLLKVATKKTLKIKKNTSCLIFETLLP